MGYSRILLLDFSAIMVLTLRARDKGILPGAKNVCIAITHLDAGERKPQSGSLLQLGLI